MLPSLTTWQFALAGLVAATGPILIHLLTRHRHRRVEWGAMELLLQAARESRRTIQLRDLAVLCLRCLAVALFGLALAQPFIASNIRRPTGARPAELTILLDNSLSMAYETLAGSRMDAAIQGASTLR